LLNMPGVYRDTKVAAESATLVGLCELLATECEAIAQAH
jgi:hypothetical protein